MTSTGDAKRRERKSAAGRLVVISGPSGSGKTTICRRLVAQDGCRLSVSDTTRDPRPGEVSGSEYRYLTREAFLARVAEGAYIEHALVHGAMYGTPREPIEAALRAGEVVLLNIDVQGAEKVRQSGLGGLFIFLLPPSTEELRRRLEARGQDSPETIARRLAAAERETAIARSQKGLYDALIVNGDIEETLARVREML